MGSVPQYNPQFAILQAMALMADIAREDRIHIIEAVAAEEPVIILEEQGLPQQEMELEDVDRNLYEPD